MRLLLILVAGMIGFAALIIPGVPRSNAQTPGAYIALGDSIAAGVGASLPRERGYAALLHELMGQQSAAFVPFENLAVPGETARSFLDTGQLDRFREAVSRVNEGGLSLYAVTLSLGGNELLGLESSGLSDREAGLAEFRGTYAEVLATVRGIIGPDTPLIVTTYYDLSEGDVSLVNTDAWWIEQFNAVIRETAALYDARVADVFPAFIGDIDELTLDPVDIHPTNAGHALIGALVWSELGVDFEPPVIDAPERIDATRETPTLRFNATESTRLASVSLEAADVQWTEPLSVEADEYVSLLDLTDMDADEATITIVVSDVAGNVARHEVIVSRQDAADRAASGDEDEDENED